MYENRIFTLMVQHKKNVPRTLELRDQGLVVPIIIFLEFMLLFIKKILFKIKVKIFE